VAAVIRNGVCDAKQSQAAATVASKKCAGFDVGFALWEDQYPPASEPIWTDGYPKISVHLKRGAFPN